MSRVSRRSFVRGMTAIPFWVWFEKYAAPSAKFVRHEARTAKGQTMLKSYAKAVDQMMNHVAEGDPTNWEFQWYTHFVKGSTTKAAEIARVYPSGGAHKALATAMWDTCQSHSAGQDERFFLPWHRMFVYRFERIVRKLSGDEEFTLPYWNYSTAVAGSHGVIPDEFRKQGDPTFGTLFVGKRNKPPGHPNVNGGQAIDQGQPGNQLGLGCLSECTYTQHGAVQGFCLNLDSNLHGNVHVLVGNSQNMGQIPWAAFDPVFWMHHCNVDRLWASWSRGGRTNPTDPAFLAKQFTFADENGNQVLMKVDDVMDFTKLGYAYDSYEPVPACKKTPDVIRASALQTTRHAAMPAAQLTLDKGPVSVSLESPAEVAGTPLTERVAKIQPEKTLFLVAEKLRADVSPGVLYHVYFDMPKGTPASEADSYYVGTLNFFEASHHGSEAAAAGAGAAGPAVPAKFFSFDVTDVAKRLQVAGKLGAKPTLTIVPSGEPEADAKPIVGGLSLVEQ